MVVGGSSGIGLACAEAAHAEGASVTIVGRSAGKLERAKDRIGDDVRVFAVDVMDEAAVSSFLERLERVDHLLVTAAETAAANVTEAETEEIRATLEIRVWGGFHAAKHAASRMDGGSITFFSGTSAHRPYPGSAIVAASSGAIEAFARALALELAPIRVNTICAGIVDTPLLDAYYGD